MNLGDILEDKGKGEGVFRGWLPESNRAMECQIGTFRNLLLQGTSHPGMCSGGEAGQSPSWESVVLGSTRVTERMGVLACDCVPRYWNKKAGYN